ncbi:MAG: DUF4347 domain-containing protein [Elainellaceae cyanobacterium]
MTSLASPTLKSASITATTALVFVDSSVDDYQYLISGIVPDAEAITLCANQDGIRQITDALAQYRRVDQVHIISHGEPGVVHLGSSQVDLETLDQSLPQLSAWKNSLADDAEILLYGCQIAAGDRGQRLIHQLSYLTGAKIAASSTLTGSAALDGNWVLEETVGSVKSPLALKSSTLQSYRSVLAPITPNLLYGIDNSTAPPQIVTIDTTTAAVTPVGTLAFNSFAITRDTATGRVYYVENGQQAGRRIAYWDPVTQQNVVVNNIADFGGEQILKLAQAQDGTLYALGSDQRLFIIDPNTGAVTPGGTITGGGPPAFEANDGSGDATFDPTNPNRLLITVTGNGFYRLYAVDVTDPANPGVPQFLGDLGISGNSGAGSLAFGQDGRLFASSASSLFAVNFSPAGLVTGTALIGNMETNISDFGTLPNNPSEIDISVTKTDGLTAIAAGQAITYSITVSNPSNLEAQELQVLDTIPTEIEGVTWVATINGAGSFPAPADQQGNGDINARVNLGAGSSVTYTVTGVVAAGTPDNTQLVNTVLVQQSQFAAVSQIFIDANLDNNTATDLTTVTATVPPTNLPPVAVDDVRASIPGVAVDIQVLTNDSDPNGDILSIVGFTQPTNGVVTFNDNNTPANPADDSLIYTPNPGVEDITDTFEYTITDGLGEFDTATVTVQIPPFVAPGTVDAINDQTSTPLSTPVNVSILTNDLVSADERPFSITGTTTPQNGSISISDNNTPVDTTDDFIIYTPNANFTGTDTFTYTISGASGASDTAVVTITVSDDDDVDCADGITLVGGRGSDSLDGTIGSDTLSGRGGDDTLRGLECDDDLFGQRGEDILLGGPDEDMLRGNQNDDVLRGGPGDDVLGGGLGSDRMFGGAGNDSLRGGRSTDELNGRQGDDNLRGNLGDDVIRGQSGNDSLDGGAGNDRMNGGAVADRVIGKRGDDTIRGGRGADFLNGGLGNDLIRGNQGPDQIFGRGGNDIIRAAGGNDFIDAGAGDDRIRGGANSDLIQARQGNDQVRAGVGNDFINGGLGDDDLAGDEGADVIFARRGNDILRGRIGNDYLDAGEGNDVVNAGLGDDWLEGRLGDDILRAGAGNDLVNGGLGDDYVGGGDGNDYLFGRRGNDRINGGAGDDVIIGGFGQDQLTGGAGRDRFVYESANDGRDTITDFQVGSDLIDLRLIFDGSQFTNPNPFRRYVRINQSGSNAVVRIDPNGNVGGRNFVDLITLENVAANSLNAQSFLL